jgi:hypothetical protein
MAGVAAWGKAASAAAATADAAASLKKTIASNLTRNTQPAQPETLPMSIARQVDEATTLTWKQVGGAQRGAGGLAGALHGLASSPRARLLTPHSPPPPATPAPPATQRAIGFGICFGTGLLLSFLVSRAPPS